MQFLYLETKEFLHLPTLKLCLMKLIHYCYHHTSLETRKITQRGEGNGVMEEVEGNRKTSSKPSSIFQNMNRR